MKIPLSSAAILMILTGCVLLETVMTAPLAAASLYWDGGTADISGNGNSASAGGTGTWDNTIQNWDKGAVAHAAWSNTTNAADTATFAGTVGTVTAGSDLVAGKLAVTGAYVFAGGSHNLTLTGTGTTINGGTLGGFNTITLGAAQTWAAAVSGGTVVNAGYALTLSSGSVTSVISGTGGLTLTGATVTLGGSNNYTGVTAINTSVTVAAIPFQNAGVAAMFGAAAVDPSNITLNASTLTCNNVGFTTNRGFTLTGACGFYEKNGTANISGIITGTGSLSFKGDYNGGGNGGNGLLVLAGANTYAGDTSMTTDCRIQLAHVNALSLSTLNSDVAARSYWDLTTNNLSYVIGGLKGSTALALGTGLGGSGAGAVSFGNNNQSNSYAGALSGAAGFTKIGTGTQTLTGANTFSGPTTVSAGTLVLSGTGSISNSQTLTVAAGATLNVAAVTGGFAIGSGQTLKGAGTVTGAVTSNGQVSPGASGTGTLTLSNNYTQNSGGTLNFAPHTATATPALIVTGTATLAGTLNVSLANGYVPTLNDTLVILQAGTLSGSFSTTQLPALSSGLDWNVITTSTTISLKVIGVASALSVAPGSYNFGGVLTGSTAQTTFVVTNTGTLTLNGTAAVTGTPFSIISGASYSLAPGTSGNVVVQFAPTAVAHFTDGLAFTSNGGNATQALSGDGIIPAALAVTPASASFGGILHGTSAQTTFVVSNTGGLPLTGTATVTGAPFAVISGATFIVNPGTTANIVVQFAPTATGAFTDTVAFVSNGGTTSRQVSGTSWAVVPDVPATGSVAYSSNPLPAMPDVSASGEISLAVGATVKQTFIPRGDAFLTAFNNHDGNGVHDIAASTISLKLDAYQNTPATFNVAISRVETGGTRTLLYSQDFQQTVYGQAVRTWTFTNPVLLSIDTQYELAVKLTQGGTNSYGGGIGGVGVYTAASDYPDGACSSGGDLWFALAGTSALPTFANLTFTAAASNTYFFDTSLLTDSSSYDNLIGKLVGVGGHPEQLNFFCPAGWPQLSFVVADPGLASMQPQGSGGNYSVTLNGLAEGETFLLAKAGATVVGYMKIQSHPHRTMNCSYSYIKYPAENPNALMGYFAGVTGYISALYAKVNIGINWTDNGVLTFEWDLNGDGSSYTADYSEVWSPINYNVLPNMNAYFSNVYLIRYNKDDSYIGGSNGGGTSLGLGLPSTPPRGANVRVCLNGTATQYGSTLSHELGHNLGLAHTGVGTAPTDNLMDVGRTADNLYTWQWKIMHNTLSVLYDVPPAVSLTAPAGGTVFPPQSTINLTASITQNRNPITKVEFYADGNVLLGNDTAAPYAYAWTNAAAGSHSLTAVAYDNQGMTATSSVANIVVSAVTHTLTYVAGSHGSISGGSPQTVNDGASGTAVTAVPVAGYAFVNWSDASIANPRTDTNVTANVSVTANFGPDLSDPDGDGLTTYDEMFVYGTNPNLADTDGDGLSDGWEVAHGTNPKVADPTSSIRMVPASVPPAVEFRFNAAVGKSYRIESSADLVHWTTIESAITGQGAPVTRTYQTDGPPKRFYRAAGGGQ